MVTFLLRFAQTHTHEQNEIIERLFAIPKKSCFVVKLSKNKSAHFGRGEKFRRLSCQINYFEARIKLKMLLKEAFLRAELKKNRTQMCKAQRNCIWS